MGRLRSLLPLALVAVVALAACDDGSRAPPSQLPELAVRLDEARLAVGVPEIAPVTSATPGGSDGAPPSPVGARVTIGATGGDGVSLRSTCSIDARIPGGWSDSTEVVVLEVGVDDCEGWTRVQAVDVESWVSDEYLPGLGTAAEASGDVGVVAPGESSDRAAARAWSAALDEASSRIALIARMATGNSMPYEAAFLHAIARDLGALASVVAASPVVVSSDACGTAAVVLAGATETLRMVAGQLAVLFEGWPETPFPSEADRLVRQYATVTGEAGEVVAECLAPAVP